MRKLSVTGLVLSGLYVVLSVLAYACLAWCPEKEGSIHGNSALMFVPFLPAHFLSVYVFGTGIAFIRWLGAGRWWVEGLFVFLVTAVGFYGLGWAIESAIRGLRRLPSFRGESDQLGQRKKKLGL